MVFLCVHNVYTVKKNFEFWHSAMHVKENKQYPTTATTVTLF